jgi:hypothetical protein
VYKKMEIIRFVLPCIRNKGFRKVGARNIKPHFGERFAVPALAASYIQHGTAGLGLQVLYKAVNTTGGFLLISPKIQNFVIR